ncbi:MAG TPA: NAD(P)/FAD-dependent oxidoreductase [Candidatus Dormibacteraeota bacterium]
MAVRQAVDAVFETQREAPDFTVAIIGSGFAGLGLAHALERERIDYVILERAGELGGTWRDNRYPGCQCDVPSHLYSFSFALNPDWSRTYPLQEEIWAYLRRVADRFGITPKIRFKHEVLDAFWDDVAQLWRLQTAGGPVTARVLVAGVGGLSEPKPAGISGLERFRGPVIHSADWDPTLDLEGKRVAVIGTGASAVQIVPRLQPKVETLLVYQRTPAWVVPHRDRPITDRERTLYRHLPIAQRFVRTGVYWLRELLVIGLATNRVKAIRRVATAHLQKQVPDGELRARLTPRFEPGCKRLLPSNHYYPALTKPNVELVTEPIYEVTEHGIRTRDGEERLVDAIVTATGFRVTDHPFYQRVRGTDGRSLAERWEATGMQAYRGTTVSGFPNLFVLTGPNTGLGHTSVIVMIESQVPYVVGAVRRLRRRGLAAVDVKPDAERHYNADVQRRLEGSVWNSGGCQSWYLDSHGRNSTLWPDFTWKYRLMMRRFDADAYDLIPPRKRVEDPAPRRRRVPVEVES